MPTNGRKEALDKAQARELGVQFDGAGGQRLDQAVMLMARLVTHRLGFRRISGESASDPLPDLAEPGRKFERPGRRNEQAGLCR